MEVQFSRANFGVSYLAFDARAPISQGLSGSSNYFGSLNNSLELIFCGSLKEIVEMACVGPIVDRLLLPHAWSVTHRSFSFYWHFKE